MKKLITIFSIIIFPVLCFGQEGEPAGDGDVPEQPVPIDGGISILVAAGIAYGVKRIKDVRRADEEGN